MQAAACEADIEAVTDAFVVGGTGEKGGVSGPTVPNTTPRVSRVRLEPRAGTKPVRKALERDGKIDRTHHPAG